MVQVVPAAAEDSDGGFRDTYTKQGSSLGYKQRSDKQSDFPA